MGGGVLAEGEAHPAAGRGDGSHSPAVRAGRAPGGGRRPTGVTTRAYCHLCRREMGVCKDGTFRHHNLPKLGTYCLNSGRNPIAQLRPVPPPSKPHRKNRPVVGI